MTTDHRGDADADFHEPERRRRGGPRGSPWSRTATRSIDDPTEIYPVLGSLSNGLASLAQALHQLGDFHDGPALKRTWITHEAPTGRSASYQVSCELYRAAEMLRQVAETIDRAHEVEATIAYASTDFPTARSADRVSLDHGIGL